MKKDNGCKYKFMVYLCGIKDSTLGSVSQTPAGWVKKTTAFIKKQQLLP